MATEINPAADFQSLPLEMIIATPLVATVKAQAASAQSTLEFVKSLMTPVGGANANDAATRFEVLTAKFNLKYLITPEGGGAAEEKNIQLDAPILSMVPIPHLRIDSVTTHFKYEITQVVSSKSEIEKGMSGGGGFKWLPFFEATLKGNVSSRSSDESTTNRSGMLEVTVHASEAPIPEGLARLLSLLAKMAEPKPVA